MWAYLRLRFTTNLLPVALLDPCHWLRGPDRATCLSGRFFFPFCLHTFSLSLYCLSLTQSNPGRRSGCILSEHTCNTVKCCVGLTNFCHVGQSRKKLFSLFKDELLLTFYKIGSLVPWRISMSAPTSSVSQSAKNNDSALSVSWTDLWGCCEQGNFVSKPVIWPPGECCLSSLPWDLIFPPSKGEFQGPHANHGVSAEQKRIRDNLLSKSRLKKVIEIVQLVSLTTGNVLPAVSVWRHRDLPISVRSKWLTVAFFEI